MLTIQDNIYNRTRSRNEPKLSVWRSAGLLLTYKCPASCRFCYYNCSPEKAGLMSIETAISAWQSLVTLAGKNAKVHITGGEPFLYFEHLMEILNRAAKEKLTPLDTLETNGYWASDKKDICEKVRLLDAAGMNKLKISCDPFHAEYIATASVKLLAETATEILGPARVLVRWEKYLHQPVKISELSDTDKIKLYKSTMKDYPFRFTGRAAPELAGLFADTTAESLHRLNCDPFHAEYIATASVKLLAETATEILGPARVLVRWEKYLHQPVKISELSDTDKIKLYKSTMKDYPFRFTGRAAPELAGLFADTTAESLHRLNCAKTFLNAKGVHIDPYGNVFSGQCSGIVIGNITQKSLEKLWLDFNPQDCDFIGVLFSRGPAGFLPIARQAGYKQKKLYADKCHLCTELRQFFFDTGKFKPIITPCELYRVND